VAAEWFKVPYPGGPAVTTIALPRPLHPKDAKGYPYSEPGPDIEAAKRVISRGGRWPWQTFSREFTKEFSRGKAGGNVGDSGVAGYQRQMGFTDSGYVGEKTYNSWRNARVPAGLPNEGQPLMDALSINLFAEAFALYNPPRTDSPRAAALALATDYVGYKESPAGSNHTKFGEWYGVDYQPWCAIFVTYCYVLGPNQPSPSFTRGSRYAYCPYLYTDAANARYGLSLTTAPKPGDVVLYDWDGAEYDHVGIVEKGNANSWTAIEGNTSTSSNSNGGQVMRRERNKSQVSKVAFVRVAE
jgi:CHAP domain